MQGDDSTDELTLRSPPFSGWPVALDKDEGFLLSFGKKPNCLEFKEKRSFVVKKSILISAISGKFLFHRPKESGWEKKIIFFIPSNRSQKN